MSNPLSRQKGIFKLIIIPKEEAIFRLDKHGQWHNKDGKFQHRKIINHFHSSIRRDEGGYHVFQEYAGTREKVYFSYEDTALFVFDVKKGKDIILILNTKKHIKLKPKNLFIKDDNLYMQDRADRIKFIDRALIRIADLIDEVDGQCFIKVNGRRYRIEEC